jgi:hypothetical protein
LLIKSLEQGGMQQVHFSGLGRERHRELLARMAFLVTRGALPDVAYHTANDGMVRDEVEDEAALGIEWDVVKAVADSWPDPARAPDARPVPGVLELARNLVGMVEATLEIPGTVEENRAQLSELCLTARMRRMVMALFDAELLRRRPPPPEEPEDDGSAAGESGDAAQDWRADDGYEPFAD